MTKIFNVRVQFFSINRKHIEMMKSFKEKNSIDYSINEIFNLSEVLIDQYIKNSFLEISLAPKLDK